MRRLSFFAALMIGMVFLTGCASTNFTTLIVQDQAEIKITASLATSVALNSVPQANRVATAREVYEVAAAVNTATTTGTVDLTQVKALANSLLAKWDSPYELAAGALLDLLFNDVQAYIDSYFASATTAVQNQAIVALLSSASTGIEQTALGYTQGVPTVPSRVGRTALSMEIPVIHFVWTQPTTSP